MSDQPKVMWTISQIADRDGVSRQAVSKVIRKLVEANDIPAERDGRGRIVRVSLAHWDHHRGQFTNPAKRPPQDVSRQEIQKPGDSFEEARRQSEWLKVERSRIERNQAAGLLVRADRLGEATEHVGREIQSIINRLPNRADDMALAVSKEGAHGLRVLLRTIAFELSSEVAACLDGIAAEAPRLDPSIGDEAGETERVA